MAYSPDLRTRVVESVTSGKSILSASSTFKVCEKTIRNWMKLYKETGAIVPRPHRGGRKSSINAEEFKSYVDANPDKTLVEMGEQFGLSYEGVAYNLRKHGYVKKNAAIQRKKRTTPT